MCSVWDCKFLSTAIVRNEGKFCDGSHASHCARNKTEIYYMEVKKASRPSKCKITLMGKNNGNLSGQSRVVGINPRVLAFLRAGVSTGHCK